MKLEIYGRNPVIEALKSKFTIEMLQIADSAQGKSISQIKKMAENTGIPLKIVSKNELQNRTGAVVHQGVTATISNFALISEQDLSEFLTVNKNPAIIVLDQVQDPHNLGAIIRTAEVAGMDLLILPEKGSATINATVAKTSAGAIFHLPILQVSDIASVIERMHSFSITSIAAVTGNRTTIYDMNMKVGLAIIIGSEGLGVRKNLAKLCQYHFTIPHWGRTQSLNASVAAGVIIYEIVRQRNL
jgi:23S rRNA (guanosine2251-2'-O)-methyltransferase